MKHEKQLDDYLGNEEQQESHLKNTRRTTRKRGTTAGLPGNEVQQLDCQKRDTTTRLQEASYNNCTAGTRHNNRTVRNEIQQLNCQERGESR